MSAIEVIEPPEDADTFAEWCITAPTEHVEAYLRARGHDIEAMKARGAELRQRFVEAIAARSPKA